MNSRIRDMLKGNPVLLRAAAISSQFEGKVYLVGGMVRDIIMERESNPLDIDIAVEGSPAKLAKILSKSMDAHLFPISREFDTWRIVSAADDENKFTIDITAIKGGSIEEDLLDRDFTINSMAIDISSIVEEEYVTVLDPRNGIEDISSCIIRSKGASTFTEDPLRLIRALRFENVLGFKIEDATANFIQEKSETIAAVSGERIRDEFLYVFHEGSASPFFKRLDYFGLLNPLLLEGYKGDRAKYRFIVLDKVELLLRGIPDFLSDYQKEIAAYFSSSVAGGLLIADILKISALTLDLIKGANDTESINLFLFTKRLKLGRRGDRLVELALSNPVTIPVEGEIGRREIYRLIREGGDAAIVKLFLSMAIDISSADASMGGALSVSLKNRYRAIFDFYFTEYLARGKPFLTGTDIIEHLNISPGPDIGRLLNMLEEERLIGNILSREGALRYIEKAVLSLS